MRRGKDAYGAELIAAYQASDAETFEIVERDDGFIDVSPWLGRYFSSYNEWSQRGKLAARLVRGRVLDVGCGAGRYALHLQQKGHDVTAIDNSPGAVKVCKWRGVKKVRLMSVTDIHRLKPDSFDTVIMMGNNFGLFGGRGRARGLLRDFHRVTSGDGQIIAEAMDPYHTKDPVHLGYLRSNRRRGRMPGQLRLRVRHGKTIGFWFDYLLVSRKEMKEILVGTGWQVARVIPDKGPGYTVVLKKK